MAEESSGSLETRADAGKGEAGRVRMWLNAIELAEKQEEKWRKAALDVTKRYRLDGERKDRGFPILYANTETLLPAIYNSAPIPDVRRRFGDADEAGKLASQVLERALSHCADEYDLHEVILDAVKDMGLPGRGVTRIRYEPVMDQGEARVVSHKTYGEHVPWSDFTIGPARRWNKVPWVKFNHLLTRKQLEKLNPKIGARVPLDHTLDGAEEKGDGEKLADIFKRGKVYEIWDKEAREVLFIAPAWKDAPIRVEPDPLNLEGFWPIPKPLYAIWTTDSLVPVEPFRIYKDQADELDRVTQRIMALIRVCKARGIHHTSMNDAFVAMTKAEDGEYVATNSAQFTQDGFDKAIWSWPLETVVKVLKELYLNREQIKQVIFELTGIADIMRGQTKPSETKGAQDLKTQWGTLRIAPLQQEVQRYARDLIRLQAEIIAEKFDPATLAAISGIQLPEMVPDPNTPPPQEGMPPVAPQMVPNPVLALLKTDQLRSYRIDIETDSTIRADVARAQEQIGVFIKGTAEFFTAIAGPVQEGAMPPDVAVDLYAGFARQFKLGKTAEDALDRWASQAKEQAKQPPPPDPEMMKAQAEQQKMAMEAQNKQAELQANMQAKAQELELKKAEMQAKLEFEQQKMALDMQKHQQQMEMDGAKHQADMHMKGQELQMREREGQMKAQLDAAKIADGRDARKEERQQMDAKAAGLPEGQKAADFMEGTGQALRSTSSQIEGLGKILADVSQAISALKAQAEDTYEGETVAGPDGRVSTVRKRYASGKVVEIPIRRAAA